MKIRLVLDRKHTHFNMRHPGFGQHPYAVAAVRLNSFDAVIKHTGVGSEALHAVELVFFALVHAPKSLIRAYPKNILAVNAKASYIAGSYKLRQAFLFIFAEFFFRQSLEFCRLFGSLFFFVPHRNAHQARRKRSRFSVIIVFHRRSS